MRIRPSKDQTTQARTAVDQGDGRSPVEGRGVGRHALEETQQHAVRWWQNSLIYLYPSTKVFVMHAQTQDEPPLPNYIFVKPHRCHKALITLQSTRVWIGLPSWSVLRAEAEPLKLSSGRSHTVGLISIANHSLFVVWQ